MLLTHCQCACECTRVYQCVCVFVQEKIVQFGSVLKIKRKNNLKKKKSQTNKPNHNK